MNILITGGCGFIGTNLTNALLGKKEVEHIVIVDNLSSTDKTPISNSRVIFREGDITDANIVNLLDNKYQFDQIYHLACPASPPFYWKDPIHTLDTCYIGTKYMLELASWQKARILFTSTSEVYGDAQVSPQPESYFGNTNSFGERSCYDEGKRVAEALCYEYRHKKNVDVRVARLFNSYGEYMDLNDGRIVTETIKALINDSPLIIYGDGEQTRSFCHVEDTVNGLVALMNSDSPFVYQPINIGNPEEQSINEMVETTARVFGKEIIKNYKVARSDDPMVRKPDISRAKSCLKWEPHVSFEEGIKRTIDYFRGLQ